MVHYCVPFPHADPRRFLIGRPERRRSRAPRMSDTQAARKKLYIETVGCQMNVLDSELVVGSLRNAGLRADRRLDRRRHDPVQHLLASASTPRTRSTPPSAGSGTLKKQQPEQGHRRPRLHGPEGPGADPQAGPVRRSGRRPRASSRRFPSCSTKSQRRRRAADGRQPRPRRRRRGDEVDGELRELRPAPRPGDAADAVPGVRADHDRLRQVLHLLHRPERPRPRAEPPARARSSPRSGSSPTRAARKSRCSARRSTATSTTTATAARTRLSRPARRAARHRRASSGSSSSRTSPRT